MLIYCSAEFARMEMAVPRTFEITNDKKWSYFRAKGPSKHLVLISTRIFLNGCIINILFNEFYIE